MRLILILPNCYSTHQTSEEGERVSHGAVGRGERGFTRARGATTQRGAIEGIHLGVWWGRP